MNFKLHDRLKIFVLRRKIRKILVPLDGSKPSFKGLDEAIYLARQCGATITGIHVVSIYPRNWGDLLNPLKTKLFKDAQEMMDKAEVVSAKNDVVFHKKIFYGDPKSDISDYIRKHGYDLVIVGARGFGPVKEMFLGSVSTAILHKSKIPVLIIK